MNSQRKNGIFIICLLLLTLLPAATQIATAQSTGLVLEKEQHWPTYRVGGTALHYNNLALADLDNDGITEIVTGGRTYDVLNGAYVAEMAPLNIWTWTGQNFTLKASEKWGQNRMWCLNVGDANGDGIIDIVTAGKLTNSTGIYVQLKIWRLDGETLNQEASQELPCTTGGIASLCISDLNNDGTPEIVTYGRIGFDELTSLQIGIWHWNGNKLALTKSVEWGTLNVSTAGPGVPDVITNGGSVCVYDLDNDGSKEIITGGFANELKNSTGQLRVWRWNGEDLTLKANEEWHSVDGYAIGSAGQIDGNTVVYTVKAGDVDDDGTPKIITGGFSYNGEKVGAQLRIWNWNGQTLTLEKNQEWTTQDIVEVRGMSIDDVDGDGKNEIVTSGGSASLGSFASNSSSPEMAQLRVWGWDGTTLTLKQGEDWYIDEGAMAQNVATGDLNKDGKVKIVTAGVTFYGNFSDPDMRLWSIQTVPSTFPYALLAAVVIVAAGALIITFVLARKKRPSIPKSLSNS